MSFQPKGSWHAVRGHVGYVGLHALLLAAGVGLLFLQRYVWLLNIANQGYGPYQNAFYLIGVSAVIVLVDVVFLRWALKSGRVNRRIALVWPAMFAVIALLILAINNA
jgi:hypothetical protein